MPRPLTDTGLRMLGSLPSVLRDSADYQGVIHPASREVDRMELTMEQVRAQFNPAQADLLLGAWEMTVHLPVGGPGLTIAQRQAKVIARLRKLLGQSEGREWVAQITEWVGSGWTYQEHDPADPSSPPDDHIKVTIPFPLNSGAYLEALTQIREITPAHLVLDLESAGGFNLDESDLDIEELVD